MSYVEPLSPRKKSYELTRHDKGTDDEFTKYAILQYNSGSCKQHSYLTKYWALKAILMLVYNIYNDLEYATVFIESNKFQYFQ